MKASTFVILILFGTFAKAFEFGLNGAGRTYVRGLSVEASIKDELLIWGDKPISKEQWQYGFIQGQVAAATHGQISAGVSLFPISFIELNYKQSWTQRYSASSVFTCGTNQCYGSVARKIYTGRMALAYESIITFYSVSTSVLLEGNGIEPIVDELENLLVNPSGDIGTARMFLLGWQSSSDLPYTIGTLYRDFTYEHSKFKNEMLSLVIRKKFIDSKDVKAQWFAALGTFKSDFSNEGLSLGLGCSWQWGESLSLF